MTSLCIVLVLLSLLKCSLCNNIESCVAYKELLPNGFCMEYFHGTKIAQTKEQAIRANTELVVFYKQYMPLYTHRTHEEFKRIAVFILSVKCESKRAEISDIINSFSMPSSKNVEQCSTEVRKIACQYLHPKCVTMETSEVVVALPCREKCIEVLDRKTCSFIKPFISLVIKLNEICPNLGGRFLKYNCRDFPASIPIDNEYCPVTDSTIPFGNQTGGVKPQENKVNTIQTNLMMESVRTHDEKAKNLDEAEQISSNAKDTLRDVFADEWVNSNNNGNCIKYTDVLPNGICSEYLRHRRIAQSKKQAAMRNKKLISLYKIYIPMYSSKTVEEVKRYLFFYITEIWNACDKPQSVRRIVDSIVYPPASQLRDCSQNIMKFVCETSHPICMPAVSTHGVLPCRDKCKEILNTPMCSFIKPFYRAIRNLIRVCPAFKSYVFVDSCHYYPTPTRKGQKYCPVKYESNELFHYHVSNINSSVNEEDNEISPGDRLDEETASGNGDEATRCVPYKSVLPSGICLKYMANSRVLQSKNQLRKFDKNIGRMHILIGEILLNPIGSQFAARGSNFWSWVIETISPTCSNITKIYELKRDFTQVPNMSDIRDCLHGNEWFYCHVYHPKCTVSSHGSTKLSPVCRESCARVWNAPSCSFVRDLHDLYEKIKAVCTVPYSEHIDDLFNCQKYPLLDMKDIGKCQLRNITNAPPTSSCYHGNGFNYNGPENTAGGQPCAMWSSDPNLNPQVYKPTLVNNYCRNPQGYGEKPWCYTDMRTKTWAYCNVKRCGVDDLEVNSFLPKYLIADNSMEGGDRPSGPYHKPMNVIIVVGVALALVSAMFIVYIYNNKKRRSGMKEYRGIHDDKPDINYVMVDHGDIN